MAGFETLPSRYGLVELNKNFHVVYFLLVLTFPFAKSFNLRLRAAGPLLQTVEYSALLIGRELFEECAGSYIYLRFCSLSLSAE